MVRQFLVGLFILGGVIFGFWYVGNVVVFDAQAQEISKIQQETADLKKRNDAAEALRQERDELRQKVAFLEQEYQKIVEFLPTQATIGDLHEQLRKQATECGLLLSGFNNDYSTKLKPGINEIPLLLVTQGRGDGQLAFVDVVAGFKRLICVRDQTLVAEPESGKTTLTIDATIPVDIPAEPTKKK